MENFIFFYGINVFGTYFPKMFILQRAGTKNAMKNKRDCREFIYERLFWKEKKSDYSNKINVRTQNNGESVYFREKKAG